MGCSKFTSSCVSSATACGINEQTLGGWQLRFRTKYGTCCPPMSTIVRSLLLGSAHVYGLSLNQSRHPLTSISRICATPLSLVQRYCVLAFASWMTTRPTVLRLLVCPVEEEGGAGGGMRKIKNRRGSKNNGQKTRKTY